MDDRLEKALEHGNYRAAISQRRVDMLERFRRDVIYAENGGLFSATPEMISFVSTMQTHPDENFILLDDRNLPILIKDRASFFENLQSRYSSASQRYFTSNTELSQARTVSRVMDIE
jgi:hypothetical protein